MDIDSVYRALPRGLQNCALTLFGFKQYRLRYGQQLLPPYTNLQRKLSSDEGQACQENRFRELLSHAVEYVPYYQRLFKKLGAEPADINLQNFRVHIPVLSKADVIAEPDQFHSRYFANEALALFTSGTSGSPLPIKCSPQARALNYAFYRALLLRHGCDVRDRSATFAGRLLLSKNETSVFSRKDHYNRTLYLSSYHITEGAIPKYIAELEDWAPDYIDSYPSAIALVADYINRHQIKHRIKLKFVLTSSETLTEQQRESIGTAFRCKIVDHYGCTEMAASASSAELGRYEVDSLYSLVEFIPAATEESYSLVCTGLINFAMPLLRYSIGDVVTGVAISQATPFFGQTFTHLVGREDDVIVTSDGRKIGRMDPVFKGLSGIKLAQIVQKDLTHIDVLVVPVADSNPEHLKDKLIANIHDRTGRDMNISVSFVESIPLSKSGKFKSVISMAPKR